jgi:hypothetical protein
VSIMSVFVGILQPLFQASHNHGQRRQVYACYSRRCNGRRRPRSGVLT